MSESEKTENARDAAYKAVYDAYVKEHGTPPMLPEPEEDPPDAA